MKPKQLILPAIIFLAIVLMALAVRLWPRTVPFDQCSDLYKQYANVEGIDATFIKDYKVNDTVFVDVTMLEATTDSAWIMLQNDFNIPIIPEEYRDLVSSFNSIDFRLAPKINPKLPMDSIAEKNNVIVTSRQNKTICVFHIYNKEQKRAIIKTKIKEL